MMPCSRLKLRQNTPLRSPLCGFLAVFMLALTTAPVNGATLLRTEAWVEDSAAPRDLSPPPAQTPWQPAGARVLIDGPQALWLRLTLRRQADDPADWLLALPTTALHHASAFGPYDEYGVSRDPPVHTGLRAPFSSRPLGNERPVFPVSLRDSGVYTVMLRLQSPVPHEVTPELWRPADYLASRKHKTLFDGLCYGILLALLVYNLVLHLAFRDRTYLYYVLTCGSALLTLSTYNGHAAHYLWPDTPWLIVHSYQIAPSLWLIFSALFARTFLSLATTRPRADRALMLYVGLGLASLLLSLSGHLALAQSAIETLALVGSLFMAGLALALWRGGFTPARWYLLGQASLFSSTILVVLVNWGLIDSPFLLANALQLGVSGEMVVFAVALSARIRRMHAERTELDQRARRFAHAAATDPLTGVANRNGLADAATRLLDAPGRHALLLVDLNRFKSINDDFGHEAGDRVLAVTAGRLQEHLRGSDVIARTGGDEFVILLADRPPRARLDAMLTRLSQALAAPVGFEGRELSISASIGIACFPEDADTLEGLQRAADRAMYLAKGSGRRSAYSNEAAA
jgi:diguanylate cyclase (GGDEF)-like protein